MEVSSPSGLWFNDSKEGWSDDGVRAHAANDEIFIVLEGTVILDVAGERVEVGPGEFCCFPDGLSQLSWIGPTSRV